MGGARPGGRRPCHRGPVLGIAPQACWLSRAAPSGEVVALEPNHSHFVLADAPLWAASSRRCSMWRPVLAEGAKVVTVVAGGEPHTRWPRSGRACGGGCP